MAASLKHQLRSAVALHSLAELTRRGLSFLMQRRPSDRGLTNSFATLYLTIGATYRLQTNGVAYTAVMTHTLISRNKNQSYHMEVLPA